MVSLVIVASLHKANTKPCCTSTITCCGLPRGKGVGPTARLMQEERRTLLRAIWGD